MNLLSGESLSVFAPLIWVMAGLAAVVPVSYVIGWWTNRLLTGMEALGLIGIFLSLVALLIGPTPPGAKLLIFLILLITGLSIPLFSLALSKKGLKDFSNEREQVYHNAIERNPQNVAARVELARNLHAKGRVTEAIEEMEYSIQLSPRTTENEQYLLKQWVQEHKNRTEKVMICRWCREDTPKDRPQCRHCGKPTSGMEEVKSAMLEDLPGSMRKLLILIPVLVIAAFLLSLLSGFGATLFMLLLIVGGLAWVRHRL